MSTRSWPLTYSRTWIGETAHAFAHERCLKETTYRHLISVEGVMRSLARRFEEDQDLWGLTGLFHDLDQDHTGDDGAQHARLGGRVAPRGERR